MVNVLLLQWFSSCASPSGSVSLLSAGALEFVLTIGEKTKALTLNGDCRVREITGCDTHVASQINGVGFIAPPCVLIC